jgi:WD40 repeat protein
MTKKEIISANQKENKNQQNTALIPQLYIYGSHYSNPLYVCHYLTRVFPYTNIGIELQGDKFDDPNRMLISVNKSFEGSTSHEGDLRELCPEFFYLPEMFVNRNNLDLKIKTKKNKDKTNDVTLPNWANNNNYIFITKLKTYLESEEVNKNINKWFDLIFGYKQKGKEAEAAFNLFIPSSYDNFDIEKEATSPDQKIYYLRLTEFGLTPHQITSKKFGKRKQKENKKKTISESWREKEPRINAIKNKKSDNNKNIFKILKLKFIDDENFLGVLSNYQFIKNEIFNFQNENEHNFNFDSNAKYYIKKEIIPKLNFLRVKNNEIINKEYPIIIYSKGEYIAEGGYYDGRIIITQLNLKIKSKDMNKAIVQTFEVINKMDTSPVIVLLITKDEKYIFSGSMLGSIVIYKNEKNNWKKKHQINDHLNIPITSIYHHDILNLWGSAGYDGYVNIYTFPSNKKISSIKVQQSALCADYIFISSSPLPCFIIYSSHDFTFYTYSLIGKLICKVCENDTNIYSPKILKESNFGEVLVYGNNRGQINMRFLPSLDLFLNRDINPGEDIINYINVDLIDISNNGWYCIAWNNDNGMFYTIYDSSHISQKEELMIIYLANDLDE